MHHPPLTSSKSGRHLIYLLLLLLVSSFCTCESTNSKTLESTAALLSKSFEQSTAASLRGVTSSQVIEYNPRNIVLMTMLNSLLILGGLLGTMARNEKRLSVGPGGVPFKRADGGLAKFKRRWLPKRKSHSKEVGATTTELPLPHAEDHHHHHHHQSPHPQVAPSRGSPLSRPPPIIEHQYYYPNEPVSHLGGLPLPQQPNHLQPNHHQVHPHLPTPIHHFQPEQILFHQSPSSHLSPPMMDIDPRSAASLLNSITSSNMLRRSDAQTSPREHRSLNSFSPSNSCGHVLRCLDSSGARLVEHPSPSELSTLALKLLNSSPSTSDQHLLSKVRELIAFEEKGQCFLHYTCHNSSSNSSGILKGSGRSLKEKKQPKTITSSHPPSTATKA